MASLLETFRVLSSFDPPKVVLKDAPWQAFGDWALRNGVAALAAYNLQYRLTGAGAPEEVKDRLLSIYQGTANDNVMKLVNFKRSVDDLQGRRIVLLSGGAFVEALYPHVAFRPVIDLDLLLRQQDVEGFSGFLKTNQFRPLPPEKAKGRAEVVLSDTRTDLLLHTSLFGGPTSAIDEAVLERAMPMKFYGPSIFRPEHEDAVLTVCLEQAQSGYQLPMLTFVDLRELLLGAPAMSGAYSKPLRTGVVRERAREWGVERALYASVAICARLFPETAPIARELEPELKRPSRALIDRAVVEPVASLSSRALRGADRLRRWLTGRAAPA